jgi:hypothetical protein
MFRFNYDHVSKQNVESNKIYTYLNFIFIKKAIDTHNMWYIGTTIIFLITSCKRFHSKKLWISFFLFFGQKDFKKVIVLVLNKHIGSLTLIWTLRAKRQKKTQHALMIDYRITRTLGSIEGCKRLIHKTHCHATFICKTFTFQKKNENQQKK